MTPFVPNTQTINQDRKYWLTDDGHFLKEDEIITRGLNEAKFLAKLSKIKYFPQYIKSYSNHHHFLEMEIVYGTTLENMKDKFTASDYFFIATQLFEIYGILREKEIVHGDINESNLIYNREAKKLWLIDFEMAHNGDPFLNLTGGNYGIMHVLDFVQSGIK